MHIGDIVKVGLFTDDNQMIDSRIVKFTHDNATYYDLRNLLVGICIMNSDICKITAKAIPFDDSGKIIKACDDSIDTENLIFKEAISFLDALDNFNKHANVIKFIRETSPETLMFSTRYILDNLKEDNNEH